MIKEVIQETGVDNSVQVITNNAKNCMEVGALLNQRYLHVFWIPYAVHILNLALQNIGVARNVENNAITFEECSWITEVVNDCQFVKNFI